MGLIDILFPPVCVGCKKIGLSICSTCYKELQPTIVDCCPYCYQPSLWGMTHERCRHRYGLDGAIAILRYNKLVRSIIKQIKYVRAWSILDDLYTKTPKHWWRIEEYLKRIEGCVVFEAIPLHERRYKERGFNQADRIMKMVIPHQKDCYIYSLKRIKYTAPQAQQSSRAARITNIKNAFSCVKVEYFQGKTVILFDDIFTSGSTAKECAYVLKHAGATHVYLITLAHGR